MALRRLSAIRDLVAVLCKTDGAAAGVVHSYCVASQTVSVARTTQTPRRDWRHWTAASAAAVGLACFLQSTEGPARCLTQPTKLDDYVTEPRTAELQRWLESIGAVVDAIDIRRSEDQPDVGLGVFASEGISQVLHVSWWKRPWYRMRKPNDGIALANFPLQATITPQTIVSDPVLGPTYQELLDIGVVDERVLCVLFLTVERLLGLESVWYAWIKMLPQKPPTPLFYSEAEMGEIRGTSLEEAVGWQKLLLAKQWERLEPACKDLLKKGGAAGTQVSLEDFLWAHAMFWSRSQSLPPRTGEAGELILPQEGMVPGLDFCNHREGSTARWTIFGAPDMQVDQSGHALVNPKQIFLVCGRQQAPAPGQEITIDYGDKPNEQLLLSYGFAQATNVNDVLMVKCPIDPPEQQDEMLRARLRLLRSRGLTPQMFLPANLLDVRSTRTGKDRSLQLPADVEETLKIFVMVPKQLAAELESENQPGPSQSTLSAMEESGERMAVLTTLVGLLEMKHQQMEGEDGTGSLESDIQLMEAEEHDEGGSMSDTKRACLLYRSSQKRIAREYLIRAHEELAVEMNRMRKLQQKE